MTTIDERIEPRGTRPAPASATRRHGASVVLLAAVACAVLGVVSVLTLPSLPSYDPFNWIIWGHEIAHHVIGPHEPFVGGGGSSWKPLPVIFTTIFGFFGASVKLWVAFSRAVGLFGLFLAYRLGSQLGRSERWRLAGPIAGILAALGIVLTSEWTHYMFRATSEPMVVAATLFAIERYLAGRRMTAFWSGVALAMMRPEAGLFVGLYALYLFFTVPRIGIRLTLVIGLILVPAAWTVPTWVAGNDPLLASKHARSYNGDLGAHPLHEVLKRATNLTVWPVIIAAGALTIWAIRTREWLLVTLAGASLGYLVVVEIMTAAHYPGLERFLLPAAAVAAVLAGVAVVRFAGLAGGGWISTAIAVALVAVAVPFFKGRIAAARPERGIARHAVQIYDHMQVVVDRLGGRRAMLPCAKSTAAINHTVQPSLAWVLQVPLNRVHPVTRYVRSLHQPSLALWAPANQITGGRPHKLGYGLHQHFLLRSGPWTVYRVTRAGDPADACVGR